jgi:hypothetical protein
MYDIVLIPHYEAPGPGINNAQIYRLVVLNRLVEQLDWCKPWKDPLGRWVANY